ncbi:peptidylprolyl isomerase [Archangium sp.]|jgi:peptidyl-prolyl cis-trans isomerase C|uniref:peptidylprolyl isomerase n=1 Tax=Archangium sp. TaxID=1872627 RepID=UPI002ED92AA8
MRIARSLMWVMLLGAACSKPGSPDAGDVQSQAVGSYTGGVITEAELAAEVARLPPQLREQFDTVNGRREFIRSMIDKRLLAQEARRRALHEQKDIQRQVRDLEERLIIQALLAEEEKAASTPSEEQLRAYYEANKAELSQPERVRVVRVLAAVPAGSSAAERTRARQRAEQFAQRLRKGEAVARVAADGDGPERIQGGDLGLFARGDGRDSALEKAAFALTKAGAVSPVVEEAGGYSVIQLVERREPRIPPFEEVRSTLLGRMQPQMKRKVFDDLLTRLRQAGGVSVESSTRP